MSPVNYYVHIIYRHYLDLEKYVKVLFGQRSRSLLMYDVKNWYKLHIKSDC